MQSKRYKPLFDMSFFWIFIPTLILLITATALSLFEPIALVVMLFADVFTLYFLVSPLFGYVELREATLFIKYGFFIKKEIPYNRIRGLKRDRKFYSESMLSLKNALDHINIKYNTFDVTAVSVVGNDDFVKELTLRMDGISA